MSVISRPYETSGSGLEKVKKSQPRCPFHKSCASLDPLKTKGFRTLATSKSGSEFTKWTSRATSSSSGEPQKEDGIVSNHHLSEHAESSMVNVGSLARDAKESGE